MKMSASIELLWQLAGQEAVSAGFAQIEPDHFFEALLKYAELRTDDLERCAPGADVARELGTEAAIVRRALDNRLIDTTPLRRELRARLGKGDGSYDGGQMHRSQTCRQLFDAAARRADDQGGEAVAAEHLLAVLLDEPTAAMREALAKTPKLDPAKKAGSPLPPQFGQALVQQAAQDELPAAENRQAECSALLGLLADAQRRHVLLATDDAEAARAVVIAAAQAIASQHAPEALKAARIIDVTAAGQGAVTPQNRADWSAKLLAEAEQTPGVILWVPAIEVGTARGPDGLWTEFLQKAARSVRCVSRVSTEVYEQSIKTDRRWRQIAQVMWIRPPAAADLPAEL